MRAILQTLCGCERTIEIERDSPIISIPIHTVRRGMWDTNAIPKSRYMVRHFESIARWPEPRYQEILEQAEQSPDIAAKLKLLQKYESIYGVDKGL